MASEGNGSRYGTRNTGAGPIAAFVLAGKTGSGKSSFIKLVGGRDINTGLDPAVDGGLASCTLNPTVYITRIGSREILLLDTPGFDDSAVDNLTILNEIVSNLYMFAIQRREVDTQGVIFLHDIAETRFGGSQRKTLEILKALVGDRAMRDVVIGTTMWSPEGTRKYDNEVRRERDFSSMHWGGIYKTVRLLDGDQNTALQIINDLLARPACLLLVQEEMLRPPHTCENTTAGRIAIPEGRAEAERLKKEFEKEMKRMQEEAASREEDFRRRHEETMAGFEEERARSREEAKLREEKWEAREKENQRLHSEQMQNQNEQNRLALQNLEEKRRADAREQREETARMMNELRQQQANDMRQQREDFKKDRKEESERRDEEARLFRKEERLRSEGLRQQQEDFKKRGKEESERRDEQARLLREEERLRTNKLMQELEKARQTPPLSFLGHVGAAVEEVVNGVASAVEGFFRQFF